MPLSQPLSAPLSPSLATSDPRQANAGSLAGQGAPSTSPAATTAASKSHRLDPLRKDSVKKTAALPEKDTATLDKFGLGTTVGTDQPTAGTAGPVVATASADTAVLAAATAASSQGAPARLHMSAHVAAGPAAADPGAMTSDTPVSQPQLADSFAQLRTRGDGSHELSIALHPADLGAVQVHAVLHNGTLTVTVACADEAARRAVTDALPQLNTQLGGLGSIDVQLGSSNGSTHQGSAPHLPDPTSRFGHQSGSGNNTDGDTSRRHREAPRQRQDGGVDRWM